MIIIIMDDIYYNILTFLSLHDIYQCCQVNKQIYGVSKNEQLWKLFYVNKLSDYDIVGNYYNTCKKYCCLSKLTCILNYNKSITELYNQPKIYCLNRENPYTTIPTEIVFLDNVQQLIFGFNKISEIAIELFLLKNLQKLYLGGNLISVIPPEISLLNNLTNFHADDNDISEIPIELCLLINLQKLNLSGNKISVIPPEISLLTNLVELGLNINSITIIPTELCLLNKLRQLGLSGNSITIIPEELFTNNLDELYIYENPIKSYEYSYRNNTKIYYHRYE